MSNPTSNFGWQMPEPTDLVTDLPADFEVFGQAVDTDFVDLLGGTTGQVLSKTSNTDLDFTWISPNPGDITEITVTSPITGGGSSGSVGIAIQDATTAQKGAVQLENSVSSTSTTTAAVPANVKTANDLAAAAIPKSTVTTNGDLIYGTGSATVSRIGIGSTSQVLTVSGGVPSWQTPAVSASGLTRISAASFGNVASVDLLSVFSATYASYLVVFSGLQRINSPGGTTLNASFYTGTNTAYTAGTSGGVLAINNSGTSATGYGSFASSTVQFSTLPEDGSGRVNGTWTLTPQTGGLSAISHLRADRTGSSYIGGFLTGSAANITGFKIYPSSGNMDGLITVYGLANS